MIEFVFGLIFANFVEWVIHKYLLHGVGRNKKSFWSFHWHEHHKASRRNDHIDESYFKKFSWNAQGKEVFGVFLLILLSLPIAFISVWFLAGAYTSAALYYFIHRKSHISPGWAKKWVPWHYDHHMGKDQDANWCVTFPLFDWVMGTRKKYD